MTRRVGEYRYEQHVTFALLYSRTTTLGAGVDEQVRGEKIPSGFLREEESDGRYSSFFFVNRKSSPDDPAASSFMLPTDKSGQRFSTELWIDSITKGEQ